MGPLSLQGRREACWETQLLARPHLLQTDPLQISAEVRPLHMLHRPRVRGTKLHSNKTESDSHDNRQQGISQNDKLLRS